jgi:hypothetical protein
VASIPVESSGNNSFTPFNNRINPPNSNARYRCHFALQYLDELEKGKNGPAFSLTSFANQNIPTTYALRYTSFARSSVQSVASSTSAPASRATSSHTTEQPSASDAQTLSSNNSSTGLSPGAVVGIAVSAIAGVLALLILGFIVWRNKRKVDVLQSKTSAGYGVRNPNSQGVQSSSAVQGDFPILKQTYAIEMQAQPYQTPPQELPGSNVVPGTR